MGCILIACCALAGGASAQSAESAKIVINIPAFTLYLYQNGVLRSTYPIGVGQTVRPSQLGETVIINEVHYPTYYPPDWYSKGLEPIPPGPDNPVGTRWLGLGFPGYGIHGTNQPHTIGAAASAGCIRMHNRDVEALAEIVGVGTPVTFMYETLEAWRDPLTNDAYVRVYKDIYSQGTNSAARLLDKLAAIQATDGVDRDFLNALVKEASGKPHPIPRSVPLFVDGQRLQTGGVEYGGEIWVSLDILSDHLGDGLDVSPRQDESDVRVGGRRVPGAMVVGGQAYARVKEAAWAFGLMVESAGSPTIQLRQVQLTERDGVPLRFRPYVEGERLLVPIQQMSARYGATVAWSPELQSVVVEGRPIFGSVLIGDSAYLAHDRAAALLGVKLEWSFPQRYAAVVDPVMTIAGSPVVERAFIFGDEVYVPLRPLADFLGYTLGWNQERQTAFVRGAPIQGVVRGGRVYAPIRDVQTMLPVIETAWDPEAYVLTVHRR